MKVGRNAQPNKTMCLDNESDVKPLDDINERLKKLAFAQKRQINQTNSTNAQTTLNLNQTHIEESNFDVNDKSRLLEISSDEEGESVVNDPAGKRVLLGSEENIEEIKQAAYCDSFETKELQEGNLEPLALREELAANVEIDEISEDGSAFDEQEYAEIKQAAFSEFDDPTRVLD